MRVLFITGWLVLDIVGNTTIDVDMDHAHENVVFDRVAKLMKSSRVWLATSLVFLIGMWTVPSAWAVAVSPTAMTLQAVQGASNPPGQTVTVSKSNNRQSKWR